MCRYTKSCPPIMIYKIHLLVDDNKRRIPVFTYEVSPPFMYWLTPWFRQRNRSGYLHPERHDQTKKTLSTIEGKVPTTQTMSVNLTRGWKMISAFGSLPTC